MEREELKNLVKSELMKTTSNEDLIQLIKEMKETEYFVNILAKQRFLQIEESLETELSIAFNDSFREQYFYTFGEFLDWLMEAID